MSKRPEALVTGGAGFIGLHVVRQLVERNCRVRVLDVDSDRLAHLPKAVDVVVGDIRNEDDVSKATRGCDLVIHLAGNPNLWSRDPREFEGVNHRGSCTVLQAAWEARAQRIVFVSTECVLTHSSQRHPIDETTLPDLSQAIGPYGRSKARAELAAMRMAAQGAPITIVIPTVPVGPGDWLQGPMTRLIEQFAAGRIKALLNAEVNLIDVRDVADGIVRAWQVGRTGARYLLGAENWTIELLFEALGALCDRPVPCLRVPYPLALGFAWMEERVCAWSSRYPMATVTGVRLARRYQRFNGDWTRRELGLEFRPCLDALRETVEWLGCSESNER